MTADLSVHEAHRSSRASGNTFPTAAQEPLSNNGECYTGVHLFIMERIARRLGQCKDGQVSRSFRSDVDSVCVACV